MKSTTHNKVRLISFDLDNALYDNLPVLAKAEKLSSDFLKQAFAQQSKPFELEDFAAIKHQLSASLDPKFENMSLLRRAALRQFCQDLKHANPIAEQAFNLFIVARSEVLIPIEIQQMLKKLASNFTLVSVSNGNCDITLSSIGGLFKQNYSPAGGFRAKPHPQMLQQISSDFKLKPAEILHVGDSLETDGLAAQNSGISFCHFAPFDGKQDFKFYEKRLLDCLALSDYP